MKARLLKRLRKEVKKYVYLQCVEVDLCSVEIVVDNPFIAEHFPHGKSYVSDMPEVRVNDCFVRYEAADGQLHTIKNRAMSKGFPLGSNDSIKALKHFRREFIINMVKKMRRDAQRNWEEKNIVAPREEKRIRLNKQLRKI